MVLAGNCIPLATACGSVTRPSGRSRFPGNDQPATAPGSVVSHLCSIQPAQRATISVAHSASCGYRGTIDGKSSRSERHKECPIEETCVVYVAPPGLSSNRGDHFPTFPQLALWATDMPSA